MPFYAAVNKSRKYSRERRLSTSQYSDDSSSGSGDDLASTRCSFCLKKVNYFAKVYEPCGHVFHGDCVWRWMKKRNGDGEQRCPLCPHAFPARSRTSSINSSIKTLAF